MVDFPYGTVWQPVSMFRLHVKRRHERRKVRPGREFLGPGQVHYRLLTLAGSSAVALLVSLLLSLVCICGAATVYPLTCCPVKATVPAPLTVV
jgi:hypothetical protein